MNQNRTKNIIGNECGIELSSQSSDRNFQYNQKLHECSRFHLSRLGICSAYLNIRHVVGKFFDWLDIFLFGRAGS